MNAIPLVLFMVFSGLSMNLMLQFALGINTAASSKELIRKPALIQLGIIFIAVILLWVIFAKIIASIISGIFIYVLLFPISSMVYEGLEFLTFRYVLKKDREPAAEPAKQRFVGARPVGGLGISFSGGITAAALFISLNIADSFIEAAALSFGFSSGILLAYLILGEIRLRSGLEAVPRFLRGKPLTLITMGLLSLIFSGVSLLLFRMLGG